MIGGSSLGEVFAKRKLRLFGEYLDLQLRRRQGA